jgi:hypothetical protein
VVEGNSSQQRRHSLCVDVPDDDEVVAFCKRDEVPSERQVWTSVAQIERADEYAQVARHRTRFVFRRSAEICVLSSQRPFAKAFAQRSRHLRSVDRGSSIYLVCELTLLELVSARVRMGNAASAPGSPGDARSAAQQQRPQQQRPAYAPTPYSPTPYYPQARDCVALERARRREPPPSETRHLRVEPHAPASACASTPRFFGVHMRGTDTGTAHDANAHHSICTPNKARDQAKCQPTAVSPPA